MKPSNPQALSTPARSASTRRIQGRHLVGVLWLCSCATTAKPYRPMAQELFCNEDDDCEIVEGPLHSCSYGAHGEPYAVAREAVESTGKELVCVHIMIQSCACYTEPEDWIAVCSDHACERRRAHFFSWPRFHCPRC